MGIVARVIVALSCFAAVASAEPLSEVPRGGVPVPIVVPPRIGSVVNSKIVFLNRCTGGCTVHPGYTDSRTDTSSIGHGTLSAFQLGDPAWVTLVTCVKNTMSRFNITVTDVDPGPNVEHFEEMVGGTPPQIGLPNTYGGIANTPCTGVGVCYKYVPNGLVFAFAGVYTSTQIVDLCKTASQELAHLWSLDHVTDATDPMTYMQYTGMRQFKDGVKCGSDCVGGLSPNYQLPCNAAGEHTCISTGTPIQNDVQIITALFGPAGAVAPTLTLTNPANGSTQPPSFAIKANCTSSDGVQEVDVSIDGVARYTLTAPPFEFMSPADLAEGPHKISVLCASNNQTTTIITADVTVAIGACADDTGCGAGSCVNGTCVVPPPGGLGTPCTANGDCASDQCGSDTSGHSYCVEACDPAANGCPSGFTCQDTDNGAGVCWPGQVDDGFCSSGKSSNAGFLILLGLAAMFITRKRRK